VQIHDRATKDETLRTADLACYLAKEKGRNRIQIHNPSDTELLHRFGEMAWVQRIHDALEEERFCCLRRTSRPCTTGRRIAYRTAASPA
jgi:HD-like signal output (HDOD) protein